MLLFKFLTINYNLFFNLNSIGELAVISTVFSFRKDDSEYGSNFDFNYF